MSVILGFYSRLLKIKNYVTSIYCYYPPTSLWLHHSCDLFQVQIDRDIKKLSELKVVTARVAI